MCLDGALLNDCCPRTNATYARVVKKLKPLMKPGSAKAAKGKGKRKSVPSPKADSKVTQKQITSSETVTEKNGG